MSKSNARYTRTWCQKLICDIILTIQEQLIWSHLEIIRCDLKSKTYSLVQVFGTKIVLLYYSLSNYREREREKRYRGCH